MDIKKLSSCYAVRALWASDARSVLSLCEGNRQFYLYCGLQPTLQQVLHDMQILPDGVERSRKHYVGFFDQDDLVAVMDCVEGYPDPQSVYIGFFMMNARLQGRGIGSAIIAGVAGYLQSIGVKRLRLAIAKANPQATCFWFKNDFKVVKEVEMDGWTALVADRWLGEPPLSLQVSALR
jgi:RimJ/RimL family protein N-acetyltransferase